jgi:hypothetical protein
MANHDLDNAALAFVEFWSNGRSELFSAAMEKATDEERAAHVAGVCAGTDQLRPRVQALRQNHAEAGDQRFQDMPERHRRCHSESKSDTRVGHIDRVGV